MVFCLALEKNNYFIRFLLFYFIYIYIFFLKPARQHKTRIELKFNSDILINDWDPRTGEIVSKKHVGPTFK
jgi:hypothetical protein